jgi:hypothetical protein
VTEWDKHTIDRFWRAVKVGAPDECWPWRSYASAMGYGRFKVDGRLRSAHRVAYELTHGPIPTNREQYHGVVVRHTCDNVRCCNPEHLRLGTQKDNARDTAARGRLRRNVLTPDDVRAIRADKRSQQDLAEAYDVAQSTVAKIRRREIHKSVPDWIESTQTESSGDVGTRKTRGKVGCARWESNPDTALRRRLPE